ncbi:DUF4446 family protein [Nocardiopsis sp. CNT312]|uniref:DUF4446 family protein n=1 Tax=Nocardiopsis sp. CNT312 TaxID=1137268 RepID=UPI0004B8896D|nr:DUF4446 family protein [Nocardiopsis sp. CNT312]
MFTLFLNSLGIIVGVGGLLLGASALVTVRRLGEERRMPVPTAPGGASGVDPRAVRDVALLCYDALEEMSGARSFSLALLNGEGDGVVLTSINGRTETRTYAKEIRAGESDGLLSPEEYRVVRSARLGSGVGMLPRAFPATERDAVVVSRRREADESASEEDTSDLRSV